MLEPAGHQEEAAPVLVSSDFSHWTVGPADLYLSQAFAPIYLL